MGKRERGVAYAAAAASALIWGFSFLFTKHALGTLSAFALLGGRFLLAAVVMTGLAALRVVKLRLNWGKVFVLLPVAVLQPVLYFLCETAGVRLLTTAEAGMIIALVPIAVSLSAMFLLRERLTGPQWGGVVLSVAGAAVLVAGQGLQAGGHLLGYLALLGAVLAQAFYSPLSRKASARCTPVETTFVMMWVGAIVFNAVGLIEAANQQAIGRYFAAMVEPGTLVDLCFLGIISSVLAFICQNWALSRLPASATGTFINLTPVVTVVAGVLINGDRLNPIQGVGAALIFLGIWGAAVGGARLRARVPAGPAEDSTAVP